MVEKDVILSKVNSIQNCLQRIHDTVGNDLELLYTLDNQDIVVLNLQRAIQQVIDIATHIISDQNYGIPQTLKDSFKILQKNKIINGSLSDKMQKMVGFRNIAVHNYEELSIDILKSIVKNNLKDIEDFYSAILMHYGNFTSN